MGDISEIEVEVSGSDLSSIGSDISDNSDNDIDMSVARNWCELNPDSPPAPPPHFPFTVTPTTHVDVSDDGGLLQFFEKYFDNILIDYIRDDQTNIYAAQFSRNHVNSKPFRPTTSGEIRVYLALIILQSVVKKPDYQLYWSKNPLLMTPFLHRLCPTGDFAK